MKKRAFLTHCLLLCLTSLLLPGQAGAFCGFYVAQVNKTVFNKTSQVIIARNGQDMVVTMSSDFEGDVEDFAMIVPVPEVLAQEQITIPPSGLFRAMEKYSSPRLVEYHDRYPCPLDNNLIIGQGFLSERLQLAPMQTISVHSKRRRSKVRIEAKYNIQEYKVLILSAKESDALEQWLLENGYNLPPNASEVLQPYIRSGMKFFVAKVDVEKLRQAGQTTLRPMQISYRSKKFMLPIRLGMANAKDYQDMLVYILSPKGRVETVNYRTLRVPTNLDVPTFVKDSFSIFYRDLFHKTWKESGKNNVILEYAWDLTAPRAPIRIYGRPSPPLRKCDPCSYPVPPHNDLMNAGAKWLLNDGSSSYNPSIFFTRLHVRYDRKHFPQDLLFHEVPDWDQYQARYVLHHAAQGPFNCKEANGYVAAVKHRRKKEVSNLTSLTGWDAENYQSYISEWDQYLMQGVPIIEAPETKDNDDGATGFGDVSGPNPWMPWLMLASVTISLLIIIRQRLVQS